MVHNIYKISKKKYSKKVHIQQKQMLYKNSKEVHNK